MYARYNQPQLEHFDHFLDLYYQWPEHVVPFWLERGVFNLLAIRQDSHVLSLCCGGGFNEKHFYANRAKSILAVDFDETAIEHAQKYNHYQNITFILADIRNNITENKYDNVLWDAAIEHFTEEEISSIMSKIKNYLTPQGVLSGYTIIEKSDHEKMLSHHEREFKSKKDLQQFFLPYFKNVVIFETIYESRHNLYFYASDGVLPFTGNDSAFLLSSSS